MAPPGGRRMPQMVVCAEVGEGSNTISARQQADSAAAAAEEIYGLYSDKLARGESGERKVRSAGGSISGAAR